MRIGRFQAAGENRIGIFEGDVVRDVTGGVEGFGDALARPAAVADIDGQTFAVDDVSYLPPTTDRNTVFCAGLNYEAHAAESDIDVPEWPLIFMKPPRALVGHEAPISYHTGVTEALDYEAELAAVIGTPGRHLSAGEALDHVAGYTIFNDTTARDLQFGLRVGDDELLDWFSGKSMQATTPMGPYVVVDEIDDPQDLAIASRVDGETMQDDSTAMMVRSVADLVAFVSSRVRLEPGDVIATGTPEGVGAFQDIALQAGETVEVDIEGIGTLRNRVEAVSE
jgi:2-keto-4-pentenoate hydratase/2-oxohepta-3-ene-1,7-dioic acid hydratase in catechol pathway